MSKTIKRVVSALLAGVMIASVAVSAVACKDVEDGGLIPETTTSGDNNVVTPSVGGEYTYRGYSTALGNNWNPHTWETNADDLIASYTTSPFVTMSIKDSKNGVYQWVYEMATDIKDVTKDNQGDLTKYQVTLQKDKTAETTEAGFVFEIKLNPNAKWEDGTKIDADDYIESMKRLLDPDMKNYRANLYYSGESAVAGGNAYYFSKDAGVYNALYGTYATVEEAQAAGVTVYIDMHNFYGLAGAKDEAGNECPQWVSITDEVKYQDPADGSWVSAADIYAAYASYLVNGQGYEAYISYYEENKRFGAKWEEVGCYKVDEYTIRYVTQAYQDLNYFLTSCTSTWLVKLDLYDANKNTSGTLVTTKYGTSMDTYQSYGPYKIASLQADKQIVFTRNENWYGWQKDENGNLYSMTNFEVDGKKVQQYQTTKVVIDVMDEATAKQAFMKGQLTEWTPNATELSTFATSEQLYQVDETYTMSFFFNSNLDALKEMDNSKGNTNSVVLSNYNFRKAFSLAVNRKEFVTATAGYKPAFSLLNKLYYYDVYNDPTSSYRNTNEAMQAIVNLYGVEYGEGKAYATLKEAHDSITGYNLDEAKKLMKTACDELVAAGLYKAGDEIKIRIGWAKGALQADDNAQIVLMNNYINAAIEGSGFGKITLEGIGNITDRYADVPKGEFAIGYGAWGGAWMYPFRNFQVYMDPDQNKVNELGCYDPKTETITLKVNGEDVTMTWQAWSNSMVGSGAYTDADFATKLSITSQLEEAFLKTYYRIPLCGTTACFLLSYQVDYYTSEYNIMYDFGGFRLMSYNLNDADWNAYVAEQGGTLSYE